MKLKRFLLRYYPPGKWGFDCAFVTLFLTVGFCAGVILEYELRDHTRELKEIDLLTLSAE